MSNFKKEKGKVIADMQISHDTRVVVHRGTDAGIVKMFSDAIERAKKQVADETPGK